MQRTGFKLPYILRDEKGTFYRMFRVGNSEYLVGDDIIWLKNRPVLVKTMFIYLTRLSMPFKLLFPPRR